MSLIDDWNEFWFAEKSPGPLGLFRIVLGCIFIFWTALAAPPNLYVWYSERGVMPLSFYSSYKGSAFEISFLNSVSDPHVLFLAWFVLLILAVMFTVGYCTRVSTILLYLMFLSFNDRNPLVLNSGDTLLRCTLFIMMLAPCGASCSIDRLIAIARRKDPGGDPVPVELWTQRIMQLQLVIVYAATVASKLNGKDWMNGTAVYYPMHMDEMTRFPLPAFLSQAWAINILTWGTLVSEASLATLVWVRRLRPYVLLVGVMLHSGIEYALNIPLFSMIMVSSYLNFTYNEWIADWAGAVSRSFARYRLSVSVPPGVLPDHPWWRVIERMDVLHLLQPAPGDDEEPSELQVSGRGWQSKGTKAMRRVVLCLPALWILAPIFLIPGSDRLLTSFLPKLPALNSHSNPNTVSAA